jgi:formate-nitrite transporter family protein
MNHAHRALLGRFGRIAAVLAGIALVVGGMVWIGNMQDKATEPQSLVAPVDDSDWYQGGKEAKVVVVEYSDFECPTCASFYPVMNALEETYGDQIKIVYRHYPITQLHPNAQLAAQAAEAAGMQGQFFGMHDLLFSNQKTWSAQKDPTNLFLAYAEALQLDMTRFRNDLTSDAAEKAVKDDAVSGNRSGVKGTPSFFVNGEMIAMPQGLDPFKAIIDTALQETETPAVPAEIPTTTTE